MVTVPASPEPLLHDVYGPPPTSDWMAIDWRAHRRWIEIDGRAANVVELGEGPPLLFVHGLSGCWQNWLENIPHAARTHRVIAVDLPGFGGSPMPREPISMPSYGRFLDRLCDVLGIEAAAVVGNSMGGFVAAELAVTAPQRVERLVLVSSAGIANESLRREPVLAGARVVALTAGWAVSRHESFARRGGLRRLALDLVVAHPRQLPAPLAFELMQGSGKPGFLPAMEAILEHRLRDRLREIACPTLIVWGAKDRIIPVRDADDFEQLIPNARKVVFPDTGHVPMLERPERFNALLDEFLAEQPLSA
jgi:pimeloyl-ACP methyl ester carboxylesterase